MSLSSTSLPKHFWIKASCEHCTCSVIAPRKFLKKEKHRSYVMFEVCKLFGPNAVLFMPNDDKVKPTSNCCWCIWSIKWNCWIMIFFIGLQQKLIPSIYGLCEITNTGDVSQSEYNFISIRSGKIDTSNAYKHAFDVRDIFQS